MTADQKLFYVVSQPFCPYTEGGRRLPYILPRGTVVVVRKGTSFVEDNSRANVPECAMTPDGDSFMVALSMKENNASWIEHVYGPFSEEEHVKGIWLIRNPGTSRLHHIICRAGSGAILCETSEEVTRLFWDFLSLAQRATDAEPVTCFRPICGDETDGPYRVRKFELVSKIKLL